MVCFFCSSEKGVEGLVSVSSASLFFFRFFGGTIKFCSFLGQSVSVGFFSVGGSVSVLGARSPLARCARGLDVVEERRDLE